MGFGAKTASQYRDPVTSCSRLPAPKSRDYTPLNFRLGWSERMSRNDASRMRQAIHTRTLLLPRSLRVLIRFSTAALRQSLAVLSEPHRLPSE